MGRERKAVPWGRIQCSIDAIHKLVLGHRTQRLGYLGRRGPNH
jgi:hypothetical protein